MNLMRFSSIFQLPLSRDAATQPVRMRTDDGAVPIAQAAEPPDSLHGALPEALDERVRLIGEWQLGDS